jgi:hypothetical protein
LSEETAINGHTNGHTEGAIDAGRRLLPIEVETSRQVSPADAGGLTAFRKEYGDQAPGRIIAYDGTETVWVTEGIPR